MGWLEILGPVVGVLGAVATFILRIRSSSRPSLKSPRSRLRQDLEILKMLKEAGHPEHEVVRNRVDALLKEVYEGSTKPGKYKKGRKEGWERIVPRMMPLFIMGVIALLGFSLWSWYVVCDGFSWWVIGTGFGALAGIGWIMAAYEERPTKYARKSRRLPKT